VDKVKVDMGKPKLKVDQIPALIEGVDVAIGMDIDLSEFGEDGWWIEAGVLPQMTLVSMGNPHVVFICKGDPKKIELEKVGKIIENDRRFPSRINVHFA
jgi:diaminopimelate epimerase